MLVPSDSILKKAMYTIRKVDGFDSAMMHDDGTMYTQKNIVDKFPGDPDTVELLGDQTDDDDFNNRGHQKTDDWLRRSEKRTLPQDSWKRASDVDRVLSIPTTNVSPQQVDWEVMASKHVLPHVMKDGYDLWVNIPGKKGGASRLVHHGFPRVGGKYIQIGQCVQMSSLYAAFNLDAKRVYHECWHHDMDCTNGLFPNQLYKNDPPSMVKLALVLLKHHEGDLESIDDSEMEAMTTKIRGSGANSKIEGDTPRDAVQQEMRGGSAGKVADNQRLTPLNIALQNLHCREALVPLFFPRSVVDLAETHSEEFLGNKNPHRKGASESPTEIGLWDKLLQEKQGETATNPKMVFMGMYSTKSFCHERLDRTTVQAEAIKYLPDSERDRNMQCFKAQNHMCLTISLERLVPPSPDETLLEIHISSKEATSFMFPTKSGVRNAISLSHPDSVTKDNITANFVRQREWRAIQSEESNETLGSATAVGVEAFVDRLCGISVAACYRFQKKNIKEDECYYLDEDKYAAIGTVSRLKAMPMPSRANDVGPLFFQWSFGFDRLKKDKTWCKENLDNFSEAIFQSVFHTLTGRVVALEQLSEHLRQYMSGRGLPVPNDPEQPVYPTTKTYVEAIYFILSTLKGKRKSISTWVIDQFAQSIPSCLKTILGFESMLGVLAKEVGSIATNLMCGDHCRPNENKRETAFKAIYDVLANFTEESEKNRLRFVTTQVLNNLDEVLSYPFGTKEEYRDFDYMCRSVFPGFGGTRGAEAFQTKDSSWTGETNQEKRARAKLKIIWEEIYGYLLNPPPGKEWILHCLLLKRTGNTLCWLINDREINFVDGEQGLCKSFMGLAAVRPSRCITNPKPYNNFTHLVRLSVSYPPNCHDCSKVATDWFERVTVSKNGWPELDQEYEYKEHL